MGIPNSHKYFLGILFMILYPNKQQQFLKECAFPRFLQPRSCYTPPASGSEARPSHDHPGNKKLGRDVLTQCFKNKKYVGHLLRSFEKKHQTNKFHQIQEKRGASVALCSFEKKEKARLQSCVSKCFQHTSPIHIRFRWATNIPLHLESLLPVSKQEV